MPLMRPQDYPPQDPVSEFAQAYTDDLINRIDRNAGDNYFYGDDPYQSIALFRPARPNGTIFAFMHGGGWTNGYKEMMGFMAPSFTMHGILFASIGYRLAPMHCWPACFEDGAKAVAWLVKHAAENGADASRIFIGGRSAGGHLSSLLAVRRDWQDRNALRKDVLRGCIAISGVYFFGKDSGFKNQPRFLGPAEQQNEIPASPLLNIQGKPPPFFMAWGEKDFPHLIGQAADMAAALRAAGGHVETMMLPGCDHLGTGVPTGDPQSPWTARALAFIAAH
jgi:acetyl esterase/lipase